MPTASLAIRAPRLEHPIGLEGLSGGAGLSGAGLTWLAIRCVLPMQPVLVYSSRVS